MTNTNTVDSTPLLLAVEKGNAFEVATLLAEGADPTEINYRGQTAKEVAKENGHMEIAALLDQDEDTITDYEETIIFNRDEDITVPDINDHIETPKIEQTEITSKPKENDQLSRIVLTGIKIPFFSMVLFMLKWILATAVASSLIAGFGYLTLYLIKTYI